MSFQTSALILAWAALLLLALVVSGLVRQVHGLASGGPRRPGPRPGSPAPGLDRLAPPGRPLLLLFLSEDCRTCAEALDEAAGAGSVLALYAGPGPITTPGPPVTVHSGQSALFDRYDVVATPYAVVVDRAGRVAAAEPVGSRAALRELLSRTGGTRTAGGSR